MKKLHSILFHRSVLVGVSLLTQLGVLVLVILRFSAQQVYFYWACVLLSTLAMLYIISQEDMEPGYKIAWLLLILPFPVFGGIFYLLLGGSRVSARTRRQLESIAQKSRETLTPDFCASSSSPFEEEALGQARYLERYAGCPLYTDTQAEYFPLGELAWARMLEELKSAQRYIFLEYFIIEEGECWDSILEILEQKAAEGVDVRLIYDDFGCMYTLPRLYDRRLEERGIRCRVFGRLKPVMTLRQNNRDHRKMLIIDGARAFTGGMNLADEYINRRRKYGHWKDSAVFLRGAAAWSMTVMFLSMWDNCVGEATEDFAALRPKALPHLYRCGWVQPYTDTPLDNEAVGQTVYLNLIAHARKRILITTPYLIIDVATNTALCNAAKAGVDVRIIVPHIPDKKFVFEVTRAHYLPLLQAGVHIYEYLPGFIHAKNFVVDGISATVGTVNLDYRSLFLHFENGVWLYKAPCIADIEEDFRKTLFECEEVTLHRARSIHPLHQLYRSVLRVFAPLM